MESLNGMSMNLPPDLCPLETQVAGHTFDGYCTKFGMLRDKLGVFVFKPLAKPLCAEREILFYKKVKETQNDNNIQLKEFIPRYEGHNEMLIYGKKHLCIKLENLTHSMNMPCVLDIKIGSRTWDPLATPDKIAIEKEKYAACKNSIGLCIPGFQIYNKDGERLKFGKEYGKSLNQKTFCDTLVMFLNAQNKCYKPLIKSILNQLYHLQNWFSAQTSMNFFSSSILIAYDYGVLLEKCKSCEKGNPDAPNGYQRRKLNKISTDTIPWVKVKMIDFAHVFDIEKESCDANYLFGLQSLVYILQHILIEKW